MRWHLAVRLAPGNPTQTHRNVLAGCPVNGRLPLIPETGLARGPGGSGDLFWAPSEEGQRRCATAHGGISLSEAVSWAREPSRAVCWMAVSGRELIEWRTRVGGDDKYSSVAMGCRARMRLRYVQTQGAGSNTH